MLELNFGRFLGRIVDFVTQRVRFPLTLRGLLVFALASIALRTLAFPEFDLAANIIGGAALALVVLTTFAALIFRIKLASRIKAEVRFDASSQCLARKPIVSGILLWHSSVPPFFKLRVTRRFLQPGVISPIHVVSGQVTSDEVRHLIDKVTFPHRGIWELEHLELALEDVLGLTQFKMKAFCKAALEVSTACIDIHPLPIVASSARAGDELSYSTERAGDPFDIKSYDPSDGVKRLLWKIYARSGNLVVRRPEPAVIPEGEIALYLVASAQDDYVAGALLGYLNQLEQSQISILFGTDGAGAAAVLSENLFVTADADIKRAINYCVWHPQAGTGLGFSDFVAALAKAQREIRTAVVFGPETGSWLKTISDYSHKAGIKVHAAVVSRSVDPEEKMRLAQRRPAKTRGIDSYIKPLSNYLQSLVRGKSPMPKAVRINSSQLLEIHPVQGKDLLW